MKLTCINCPMGCTITVTKTKEGYKFSGNNCARGEAFARDELTAPKRMVTALIHTDRGVTSVKTDKPIDKKLIFKLLAEIDKIHLKNAKMGQIVIKNALNTGVNVVVTKSI